MRGVLGALHDVVEVRPGGDHGPGADGLACDDEERAGAQEGVAKGWGQPGAAGEQEIREQALDEGGGVGQVVGGAILG